MFAPSFTNAGPLPSSRCLFSRETEQDNFSATCSTVRRGSPTSARAAASEMVAVFFLDIGGSHGKSNPCEPLFATAAASRKVAQACAAKNLCQELFLTLLDSVSNYF